MYTLFNKEVFGVGLEELEKALKIVNSELEDLGRQAAISMDQLATNTALAADKGINKLSTNVLNLKAKAKPALVDLKNNFAEVTSNGINILKDGLVALGNKAPEAFKVLQQKMRELISQTKDVITNFFSLNNIVDFISGPAAYAAKIGDLSDSLGTNTEEFSHWADVVASSGGDLNTFHQSLQGLKKGIDDVLGGNAPELDRLFNDLGISLVDCFGNTKDVLSILPELATCMEKMSSSDATKLGEKLGLDDNTISLLKKGSAGLEEMLEKQRLLGGVTAKEAATAQAFSSAIQDIQHALRTMALKVGMAVVPALGWFMDKLELITDYMAKHEKFFTSFFIGIAAVIALLLVPAIWAAFAPILAMGALLVGLGLIFTTVFNYFSEKMNETGGIFEKLRGWASTAIEYMINGFSFLADNIGAVFEFIGSVITGIMDSIFTGISTLITSPIDALLYVITTIMNGLNMLGQLVWDFIKNMAASAINSVKSWLGFGGSKESPNVATTLNDGAQAIANAQQLTSSIAHSPAQLSMANQRVNNKNTAVNVGGITINTQATDPKEIMNQFDQTLASTISEHYNDGVGSVT